MELLRARASGLRVGLLSVFQETSFSPVVAADGQQKVYPHRKTFWCAGFCGQERKATLKRTIPELSVFREESACRGLPARACMSRVVRTVRWDAIRIQRPALLAARVTILRQMYLSEHNLSLRVGPFAALGTLLCASENCLQICYCMPHRPLCALL